MLNEDRESARCGTCGMQATLHEAIRTVGDYIVDNMAHQVIEDLKTRAPGDRFMHISERFSEVFQYDFVVELSV